MSSPNSDPTTSESNQTNLPVPAENSRTYLQVRPTEESLDPDNAETHLRRLHQLNTADETGLLSRFRTEKPPTVECLLISKEADAPIQYQFGVDDPEAIDTLERILRGLFPDAYELERVTKTDDHLRGVLDPDDDLAAVEFQGAVDRRSDWQTRLTPYEDFHDDQPSVPLAAVVETMAATDCPMVYQALVQPTADWSHRAAERRRAIETHRDTLGGQLSHVIFGPPEDVPIPASDQTRLDELDEREPRRSFVTNARLAVGQTEEADNAAGAARELASAFASVSHTCYEIEGKVSTGTDASAVADDIADRTLHPASFETWRTRLPFTTNSSRGIVADASEVGSFCLLGGDTLNASGARAVGPTPGERTAIPRPPVDLLSNYREDGLLLGTPLTQDGSADTEPLALPPKLQPLHVGWFGKTGSGKSTGMNNGILSNHSATDGADIFIGPKGDGMPIEYLRAHYATHGTLENVLYFDCSSVLPAFSFFDIRDQLAAGISRTTAVEDSVDHYIEILTQIMGRDRFNQAVRSPDVIRYLVKAMYDPVSGDDAFSHRELHTAVRQMHERQTTPAVVDEDLERMLEGVVANRSRSFDEIMQGVANRMEKIPVDRRLARVFNHVPEAGDPHFDLVDYLDEDVVIIFDTGDLRSEAQRVLTLVILSNLWTALRRRSRRSGDDNGLVNLYVEEAASVAVSDLLTQLLSQSRGFDCSVTLAMQFPGQLRGTNDGVYDEVLNNISTFVTGNVPVDKRLAERLATDEMGPQAVGNRLRALRRGQWLVSLPAAFDQPEPRPFLIESAAPPPGDPAGDRELSAEMEREFEAALDAARERTAADSGLTIDSPSRAPPDDEPEGDQPPRVDTALPHTNRLPTTVAYRRDAHLLACRECDTRFDPDVDGMRAAIECCSALERTDTADVPICELNLKLTPTEREASDYVDPQLMFLQAVYNAQQLRYDDLEYDLVYDSMIRLQEYVGVDSEAVQDLIDDGVLTHDTDRPHRLYSVTPDGRSTIGETYRLGEDYGHGQGDLEETSLHVLAVELGRRYLIAKYKQDPDSEVVEVLPYFDLERENGTAMPVALAMGDDEGGLQEASDEYDHRRLDVAGLDADGNVVVAVEAERINHDHRRAVPRDFDKMADCDPDEAIWIAMSHAEAHEILGSLNNPLEGEPRVEKTYSGGTPADQFHIDAPGCTGMYTVTQVREMVEELNEGRD